MVTPRNAAQVVANQQATSFSSQPRGGGTYYDEATGALRNVNGITQQQLQRQIGSNLELRRQSVLDQWNSGKLTQDQYDSEMGDVNSRMDANNRLLSTYGRPELQVMSGSDKRQSVIQGGRQAITDRAGSDAESRRNSGQFVDPEMDRMATAAELQAYEEQLQSGFAQDTGKRLLEGQRRQGVGMPGMPGGNAGGQRGTGPGGVALAPSPGQNPPMSMAGGKSPYGTDPASRQIAKEEAGAAAPMVGALDQVQGNEAGFMDAAGNLIGQQQNRIGNYGQNAKETIESNKRMRLDSAKQSMDMEHDLFLESLERERRDEELSYQETRRKLDREESEQILQNTRSIQRARTQLGARYGGFGSGAGLSRIEEAQLEGDKIVQQIREVAVYAGAEHRNNLADLESSYRLGTKGIMMRHDSQVNTILGEAMQQALQVDGNVLAEEGELTDKAVSLLRTTFDRINDAELKTGEVLSGMNRNIIARKDALKAQQETSKKDALGMLQWHIATYGNANPEGMRGLLKRMNALGMDTAGFNSSAPTLEQMNQVQKAIDETRFAPGQYRDETTGESLGDLVLRVTSGIAGQGKMETAREMGFAYLEAGDQEGFDRWLEKTAYDALGEETKKDFRAAGDTIRNIQMSRGTLAQFDKNELGWWKSFRESKKPFADFQRDETFIKLKAQVEADQARIRNAIFGAALSPQEAELATSFLVDFNVDTYSDITTKLDNMERLAKDLQKTRLDYETGNFSNDGAITEMGAGEADEWLNSLGNPSGSSASSSSSQGGGYDGEPELDKWLSGIGPVLQRYDTKIGYTVHGKNQHQGLDIDGKIGDPIPAFRGGKVISVIPDPHPGQRKGWGNRVIVQDSQGYKHQYSHLSSINVKEGDTVSALQEIGKMGNTGYVIPGPKGDGSHLDYEVLDANGNPVDPEKLYRRNIATASPHA